jgi:hypothetical protein
MGIACCCFGSLAAWADFISFIRFAACPDSSPIALSFPSSFRALRTSWFNPPPWFNHEGHQRHETDPHPIRRPSSLRVFAPTRETCCPQSQEDGRKNRKKTQKDAVPVRRSDTARNLRRGRGGDVPVAVPKPFSRRARFPRAPALDRGGDVLIALDRRGEPMPHFGRHPYCVP